MVDTLRQNDEPGFEKELASLEQAVNLLERGELGLEAAIREYERGYLSLKRCQEILERAQRKIEQLTVAVSSPPVPPEGAGASSHVGGEASSQVGGGASSRVGGAAGSSPPGTLAWRPFAMSPEAPAQHAPADEPPEQSI